MPHEPGQDLGRPMAAGSNRVPRRMILGPTDMIRVVFHAISLIFRIQSCYTCSGFPSANKRISLPRAEVAQLAEHSPEKAGVGSSILPLGTNIFDKPAIPIMAIFAHGTG